MTKTQAINLAKKIVKTMYLLSAKEKAHAKRAVKTIGYYLAAPAEGEDWVIPASKLFTRWEAEANELMGSK